MIKFQHLPKRLLPYILLLLVVIWSFFPVFWIVLNSFKEPKEIWNPFTWSNLTMGNYVDLFRMYPDFSRFLLNSIVITFSTVILVFLVSVPASYMLSRIRFRQSRYVMLSLIFFRFLPPIAVVPPLYAVIRILPIFDKHYTLVLLYAAMMVSISTWMIKTFFDEVPVSVEEAAMLDGCSRIGALLRVTLPLAAPGLGGVGIFSVIMSWNEFMFARLFTGNFAKTATIQISEIYNVSVGEGVPWGVVLAASTILVIPIFVFAYLVEKQMIRGMVFQGGSKE